MRTYTQRNSKGPKSVVYCNHYAKKSLSLTKKNKENNDIKYLKKKKRKKNIVKPPLSQRNILHYPPLWSCIFRMW